MSNQRQQKPTLTGQRFKTRKRGEKLKGLCLCCPFFKQVSSPPGSMKNVCLIVFQLFIVLTFQSSTLVAYDHRQRNMIVRFESWNQNWWAWIFLLECHKWQWINSHIYVFSQDEKERFDPSQFQESIIQGLNQTGPDLEAVAKFLDTSGAKLDYRRYAETLFDILVAGGMLGKRQDSYICLAFTRNIFEM